MAEILPINALFDKITEANKNVGADTAALQKTYSEAAAIATGDAETQLDVGINNQIIAIAKTSSDLAIQQARIKSANAFGTNMKDAGEVITSLAATVSQQYKVRESALSEIEKKRKVSFFDNPLAYVTNQFTINDDIDAHNTANERLENASDQLSKINNLTQATVQTQNMLDESITAASSVANSKNLADAASIKANVSRIQALTYNVDSINAALTADKNVLANSFSMFQAQKAEQQATIALEQFNLQREKFAEEKYQKALAKGSDDELIDNIITGRIARLGAGAELITKGSVRANTVLSLLKSNSPAGQEYSQDYLSGVRSRSLGYSSVATSAAHAVEVFDKFQVKITPAMEPVKNVLASVYQEALSGKAVVPGSNVLVDPKNKAQLDNYINVRTKELLDEQARKVIVGDPNNVFNIPSLKSIIEASPSLNSNSAVQKFLLPLIEANVDVDNPKILFPALVQATKTGQLTYSEMLTITEPFQRAAAVRNASRGFVALGLGAGIKNSYNVPVRVSQFGFGTKEQVVNFTDSGDLSRWINRTMAAEAFIEYRGGTGKPSVGTMRYRDSMNNSEDYAGALKHYWASEGLGKENK